MLSYACSTASGDGCTYRCETVTLECPIILIIVKASAPASPSRVRKYGESPPRCRWIEIEPKVYSGCAYGDGDWEPFTGPCDCPTCYGSGSKMGTAPTEVFPQ